MTSKPGFRKKPTILPLQEKLEIIKRIDAGSSRRDAEVFFNCSRSTIARVIASKKDIMLEAEGSIPTRRSFSLYKELDKAMTEWASEMKKSDAEITVKMAREKAAELSSALGNKLAVSTSWLYKWKERANVQFHLRSNRRKKIIKLFLNDGEKTVLLKKLHDLNSKSDKLAPKKKKYRSKNKTRAVKRVNPTDRTSRKYKTRTYLTLSQKLEIILRIQNGECRSALIKEYNLSFRSIRSILNNTKKYIKLLSDGEIMQRRVRKDSIFKNSCEIELNDWVRKKMEYCERLTRIDIRNKAREIAKRLDIEFKASTGWLARWKKRMNYDFSENNTLRPKVTNCIQHDKEIEQNKIEQYIDLPEYEIKEEQSENDYSDVIKLALKKKKTCSKNKTNAVKGVKPTDRTRRKYKTRTYLTLSQKLEIKRRIKNGECRSALAKEYNLSFRGIRLVLNETEKLIKLLSDGEKLQNRVKQDGTFKKDGEIELNDWVRKKLEYGESLRRIDIRNKAREIAKRLDINFKASTGWFARWKKRMNFDFNENDTFRRKVANCIQHDKEIEQNKTEQYIDLPEYEIKEEQTENDKFVIKLALKKRKTSSKKKTRVVKRVKPTHHTLRKYKTITYLTLSQKLEIIRRIKNGECRSAIAKEYNLSFRAIRLILNDTNKLIKRLCGGESIKRRVRKDATFKKAGEIELNDWVRNKKEYGESLTRIDIRNKAIEIAKRLDIDFKASTGWLARWKKRMNFDFSRNHTLRQKVTNCIQHDKEIEQNKTEQYIDLPEYEIKEEQTENDKSVIKLALKKKKSSSKNKTRAIIRVKPTDRTRRKYKTRTYLTLSQKLEIIRRIKNDECRSALAKEYNLSVRGIRLIVNDQKKLIKRLYGGESMPRLVRKDGIFQKAGEIELNDWVRKKFEYGESVTRINIRNKAREIAKRLGIDFKASTGWLAGWTKRMNFDFNENFTLLRKVANCTQQHYIDLPEYEIKEEQTENDDSDVMKDVKTICNGSQSEKLQKEEHHQKTKEKVF